MRFSYNWLKELVPELTASSAEVAKKLTMHSFETEVVGTMAIPAGIKAVQITNLEPHPKADRLRLATVTDGQEEVTIICGASNIAAGQVVPYSPPGTVLVDEEGNDFTIREAEIRGLTSPGMLNSLSELGLHHSHDGIWNLPSGTELGAELAELIPSDTLLEADITPNRAHDCMSHLGLAREIAALYELAVAEPDIPAIDTQTLSDWQLTIEDENDVRLYYGSLLDNIAVSPAPLWMQARILAAGTRPINNVVDITNYVMFEQGNPTHAFDAAKFTGKAITTRKARAGERIILLDETDYALHEDDLVVVNDDTPVILGGIMGGAATQVDVSTTSVFLEVANFRPFAVQRTSARLSLITEGSKRWVKNVPLSLAEPALRRTIQLLIEHAGASLVGTISQSPRVTPRIVAFEPNRVSQLAGIDISANIARDVLVRLRCEVDDSGNEWQIRVPADRLDLTAEHELVEEVIRLYGLENIPSSNLRLVPHNLHPHIYWTEAIRDALVELGLTETMNYAFENEVFTKLTEVRGQEYISLVNPPAPELANLRVSLLPGLFKNLETNREQFQREGAKDRALFEIGSVFKPGEGGKVPGVIETINLVGVIVGEAPTVNAIAQALRELLGIDDITLTNIIAPTVAQQLKYRLPVAGFEINLTELLPMVTKGVPDARSLDELVAARAEPAQFVPLPKYPSAYRDLSVIVSAKTSAEQVQAVIERAGNELVADIDLFDEYVGNDGKVSYGFHIEYRSVEKTLASDEINELHNTIVVTLKKELSAELRE